MASWLVIDWDQDQFHLLAAQGSRRGVQVGKAITWTHPEPFTPSTAERVGKALRDFLKSAGIAPAPVIVGLGRDRVFLKELRFPPIAEHEQAALVRFQTSKELAEPADNYAIDFVQLNRDGSDRQVMTVAARREVLASLHALCLGAGLKLHAVTPRLFGVASVLARSVQPQPSPLAANKLNVVLSVGQRWAELCFFNGERLIQAQALANGALLVAEVKRNLAVFRAQHAVNIDLTGPECLYVFGDAAVMQALQAGQPLPVQPLSPLDEELEVAAKVKNPAYFAGAVGLAGLWSQSGAAPINLAAPKKAQAPVSVTRRRALLYGSAAALVLVSLLGGMYFKLAGKKARIAQLALEKRRLVEDKATYAQQRAEVEAYREWERTTVPWLDELYDLTARFPFEQKDFRINKLNASPAIGGARAKGKGGDVIGIMSLQIVKPPKAKQDYVNQFLQSMVGGSDPHISALPKGGSAVRNPDAPQLIEMTIDIKKQPIEKYTTHLVVPRPLVVVEPAPAEPKAAEPSAEEGDEP